MFWPFSRKQKAAAATRPPVTAAPRLVAGDSPAAPLKMQAMLYLDATLSVLQRERIPLGQPVHGQPARGARFVEIPIHLNRQRIGPLAMRKALSPSLTNAVKAAAGVDELNVWQQRDALIYQYQVSAQFWKFYKRIDLPSPDGIGLGVGRQPVPFILNNKNTLVAGETRSGKSVTLESILFAIMQSHAPDEVGLVVIDPNQTLGLRKQGFKAVEVGSFTNAAHLLRPVAHSPGQISQAIDYVYAEWKRRMTHGIQDGPAIALVIDELMSEAVVGDRESGTLHEAHLAQLTQIASQGIKNNVFLVVGAQDPKISSTSALLMRNLSLRYIGRVTDYTASRSLAGRGGVNAHLLTGDGDFVQVTPAGQLRFQVAEPTRADFERLERRPVEAGPVGPVTIIDPPPAGDQGDDVEQALLNPALLLPGQETEVDPLTLALYFHRQGLSVRRAAQEFGIIRRVHEAHAQFAAALQAELLSLAAGNAPASRWCRTEDV